MVARVFDGGTKRLYLPATPEDETVASLATPAWSPELQLAYNPFSLRRHFTALRDSPIFSPTAAGRDDQFRGPCGGRSERNIVSESTTPPTPMR